MVCPLQRGGLRRQGCHPSGNGRQEIRPNGPGRLGRPEGSRDSGRPAVRSFQRVGGAILAGKRSGRAHGRSPFHRRRACLDIIDHYQPVFWALENPVGRLRRLRAARFREPRLIFNPCDYGDPYTKKTLLWGRFNLPKRSPVEPVKVCAQGSWIQRLGGKSDRTKLLRSMTPPGFARAFFRANR